MDLLGLLVERIVALSAQHDRVLFGLDGPDASGKTTLADRLAERLEVPVVRASIDDFDQPAAVRHRANVMSGESYYRDAFDHDSFRSRLLEPFAAGDDAVLTHLRDRMSDDANEQTSAVPPRAVLVIDGVFLQRPELRDLWTYVVYLSVDPQTSLARARTRDIAWVGTVEEVERDYHGRYLPGQALYRELDDPERRADLVVDNTDPQAPAVLRHSERS